MATLGDPRIGSELLGYRIEALVGRGGMGAVYRAEDLALGRKVALKLLAPELASHERFRARFQRESRLAASIDHPSIVPIYEAGEVQGQLYIAMRYVEGTDLGTLLRREGRLEPARALAIVAPVADALDEAHEHGLVHRDVKPSNVLLDTRGRAFLADFGLTKRADDDAEFTGGLLGTVDYVAPETIEGSAVDARADVYSLAALLHECLTGRVPFVRDTDMAVLWAHVHDPPGAPRLPRARSDLREGAREGARRSIRHVLCIRGRRRTRPPEARAASRPSAWATAGGRARARGRGARRRARARSR